MTPPLAGTPYGTSVLRVEVAAAIANREIPMATNERKTFDIGRSSKTGQFIPVKEAERRPNTTTVERVPKPGYGDTKNEPSRRK